MRSDKDLELTSGLQREEGLGILKSFWENLEAGRDPCKSCSLAEQSWLHKRGMLLVGGCLSISLVHV